MAILTPGFHELLFTERQQRYTLSIPAGYTGEEPVPFVFCLHWGGQVTPFYGRELLESVVEPGLRELGAIMAAPDCQHGHWNNPASESEALALIAHLCGQYALDLTRTLLTGYSKGGLGTWYLGPRQPDLFAAALPLAARPAPDPAQSGWRIPLYALHGREDELFPPDEVEAMVALLRMQGADVRLTLLDGVTHYASGRFVRPLRELVPWIKAMWARRAG
ncbi:MAG: dienelactone hydrolase family protein [Anaerolineae bacterium]|nr:dienelactone hydrolase family protein [Anaerolineae bacterium]